MFSLFMNFIRVLLLCGPPLAQSLDVRLVTYNIRYDATNREPGEEPWATRVPLIVSQLHHITAGQTNSLLCFQEALDHQVQGLRSGLGNDWTWYGVGREGGTKGEYSPIFYRSSVWKLQKGTTYWLSPTPTVVGSKGWDAALPRIVTIAQFTNIHTGLPFIYMCTHFDHQGQVAREKSADFIVDTANRLSLESKGKTPVFLGGDLNIEPDNQAYKTLASKLGNVRDKVPKARRHGNTKTYTAFTEDRSDDEELDHIFVKNGTGVEWRSFAVLNTRFDDNIFISDHRPVVVDFKV
jgi:endonuclease/exonuclease/phosphatase family metal-dependent hydrolase